MYKKISLLILLLVITARPAISDIVRLDTTTPLDSVYILPNNDADLITVGIAILAGEVNFDGPEGMSHYLEHLMYWHADNIGKEAMHSRSGNAWVNGIITHYYNIGESTELDDMLEFAYRVLSPPTLDQTFMQDERKVVAREYDLRVSENPNWRVLTDVRKQLYNNHPVSRSVIGTPDSIMSQTVDQATAFHKRFYHAANAVLFVSGDITQQQVLQRINNRFSDLPTTSKYKHSWRQSDISGSLDITQQYPERQAKSARLVYSSLSDWSSTDALQDAYTVLLTNQLLESALPGSLAKPLRLDNFIVSGYELEIVKLLDKQIELNVIATPDAGVTLKKVQSSLQETIAQQGIVGIPEKSLERIRKRMLQTAKRESHNEQAALWRALWHLSLGLEPNTDADHLRRIQSITKSDVDKLLAALGKPQRRVVGHITGE